MAAPVKYTPSFSFSGYQATQPDRPLPGPRHDTEYFNIAYSLGQTIDALNEIRRDDGKLENGIVDWDSLAPGLGEHLEDLVEQAEDAAETAAAESIVYIADSAPNVVPNKLWWDSNAGTLFVKYNDGDSIQWVEIAGSGMSATAAAAAERAEDAAEQAEADADRAEAAVGEAVAAAEEAADSASQAAGAVSDVVTSGNVPIFSTVQNLLSYSVNPDLTAIRVNGYETVGDGGGAFYVKKGSAPSHPGKFQSGDGAWWELNEGVIKPEMFGAKGNGIVNDSGALQAASAAGVALQAELLFTRDYLVTANTTIVPLVRFSEYGSIKAASGITVTLAGGFDAPERAHIFDISANGFIWPTKGSPLTQYHYGARNDIAFDSTKALQATIDANLYFMKSDCIRMKTGVHRTTAPLMLNYGNFYCNASIEGPGLNYDVSGNFMGLCFVSDHWGNCLEGQGLRASRIKGIMFYGPFNHHITSHGFGHTPDLDPYPIENWVPNVSLTASNPYHPTAGPTALPGNVLGRHNVCSAVHIDPRSGAKPVVVVATPVRFLAKTGDIATAFENGDTFDGLTLATGDRFLYAAPTDEAEAIGNALNGVYIVQASGAAIRDATFDRYLASVSVTSGTFAGTQWFCNNRSNINVFWQYSGSIGYADYPYPTWTGVSTQYSKNHSSDVSIQGCYFAGYAAGVCVKGCESDGNADFIRLIECVSNANIWGFTWGHTQSRNNVARDCVFSVGRTHFSNEMVGIQTGKPHFTADNCHVGNCMDIVQFGNGGWGGGVVLTNCYGEENNRIGSVISGSDSRIPFVINGGEFSFAHAGWRRKPGYIINCGNVGVSLLGGVHFVGMTTPLIIAGDPTHCTIEAGTHLGTWIPLGETATVAEALAHQSTMDVMFLDRNQGPWHGKGRIPVYNPTGVGRYYKSYGSHANSYSGNLIPFCARTAGGGYSTVGGSGAHAIPVALGGMAFTHTWDGGILTSPSQTNNILTFTIPAYTQGQAMQMGLVAGSICCDFIRNNLFYVVSRIGTTLTLRQLNNLRMDNTAILPSNSSSQFSFVPVGYYTPMHGYEMTYTTGSPTVTFARADGVTTDEYASFPVGAARVAHARTNAMMPVTETGSVITAAAAGTLTFSGNARRTTVERAELFFIPR